MSGTKLPTKISFHVEAVCSLTKARAGCIMAKGDQKEAKTPVFMPVGTQGTVKGLECDQLQATSCRILLANTYHLGNRPGTKTLREIGGLHTFMNWPHLILTDSGGFQMVSLLKLAEINEEGVAFQSPYDGSTSLLTPERCMQIQEAIGADIIMQLDDVVKTTTTGYRVEEAMHRSVRWLDRCRKAHTRPDRQSLFPIVQGGLEPELRRQCIEELVKRPMEGFAVGGLSGGESKDSFWRIVLECTRRLPEDKPRYLMGVGYAIDMVVCVALGIDMFDCVYPTRTARFGTALVRTGHLKLKDKRYELDFRPIEEDCSCATCLRYTRSYLHHIVTQDPMAGSLLSIHNVHFQMKLMQSMREAIVENKFPEFIRDFMSNYFGDKPVPQWIHDALKAVGVHLPSSPSKDGGVVMDSSMTTTHHHVDQEKIEQTEKEIDRL